MIRSVLFGFALWMTSVLVSSGASPCTGCDGFENAVALGQVPFNGLTEASGVAVSRRNYNVFWTHNDGSQGRLFALSTNGTRLATFDLTRNVDDLEDLAVGPGPTPGVSYLYVADSGAAGLTNDVRSEIKILRVAEPFVDLAWATNARTFDFAAVESFTLTYPDGSYDAETLMIDPVNGDLWVATKQVGLSRLYKANLNAAEDRAVIALEFVQTLAFSEPSSGDISPSGDQIIVRREDNAELWLRCEGESISAALSRPPVTAPIVGPPIEPNGEAIAFLADGTGYVTLSEGSNPTIYFFRATCVRSPQLMVKPESQSVFAGQTVTFQAAAAGNPAPEYTWRFEGSIIPGQTNSTLVISNVASANAGEYEVIASNSAGSTSAVAVLAVRTKPQVRITEVMPSPSTAAGVLTADWWELTNFEQQPVQISGWRFNDNNGGLGDPFQIASAIVISPGESIVLVEGISPSEFRAWWGETNLPPDLQIVSYTGSGLGLGAGGDSVRLWDGLTVDVADVITSVTFGTATTGSSFSLAPGTGEFGAISLPGVNGAFLAAMASDVGSPGRIGAVPTSPLLRIGSNGESAVISFSAEPGRIYKLESRSDIMDAEWSATGDVWTSNTAGVGTFTVPLDATVRFFRVTVE